MLNLLKKFGSGLLLVVLFAQSNATAFAQESAISQIGSLYPELSLEDATYVAQRLEFENVSLGDRATVDAYVNERLDEYASQALVYPTEVVDVSYKKIDTDKYSVTFNLKNKGATQSDIKYRVSLRSQSVDGSEAEPKTYSVTYPEVLTIAGMTSVKRIVEFVVPDHTSSGEYVLAVELGGEHGIIHSVGVADELVMVEGHTLPLAVSFDTCLVKVSDDDAVFELLEGVDVGTEEDVRLVCTIENKGSLELSAQPRFTTYLRNTWGEKIGETVEAANKVTFLPGEKKEVTLVIPKETIPQAYDAKVELFAGSDLVAEPVIVHYVVQGASATVHSVTMDSTSYKQGSTALLNLAWSGSADNFADARNGGVIEEGEELVAEVSIHTLSGQACSDVVTKPLPLGENGLESISINVVNDCPDVVAEVTLKSSAGEVLSDRTFNFASIAVDTEEAVDGLNKNVAPNKIVTIVAIALAAMLLIVLIILVERRRRNGSGIVASVLILMASFGISAVVYGASFNSSTHMWNVRDQGWSLHTATIAFTGPSGTYRNSQNVSFAGNLTAVSCANSRARSNYYLTITGPTNRNASWGAASFSASYRANTFRNGSYRAVIRWTDGGCQHIVGGSPANYPANRNRDHQCTVSPDRSETFYFTVDNDPAGTISAGGCTIAAGASTCTVPVDWNITNPNGSPNLRNLTHSYVYSWRASGNNVWQTLWYGAQTIAARDGSTNLATVAVTASCAAGSTWNGSVCLAAVPALGSFDAVDPATCSVVGWAYDPDSSASSIPIHIYRDNSAFAGGVVVGTCLANVSRPDVNAARGITGNHGFNCTLPVAYKGTGNHNLYIHAIDTNGSPNNVISGSPRAMSCSASPAATISGSGCAIPVGGSTCSGSVTWNITNPAISPNVYNLTNSSTFSSVSSGNNQPVSISYGNTVLRAQDGSNVLASASLSGTCAGGSGWDGTVCSASTPPPSPTATISADPSPCYISVGNSTCSTDLTWDIDNASNPNVYNTFTSSSVSSNSAGTQSINLSRGANTFEARDSSTMLSQTTVTVGCIAGSAWDGSVCAAAAVPPEPAIDLDLSRELIRSGETVDVTVDVTAEYPAECTLYGVEATPIVFTHNGTPASPLSSNVYTSRPLSAAQIITMTCEPDPANGAPSNTATSRVNVVPVLQEI